MAKELLCVREEEAKGQLSVRVPQRVLELIDGYAAHTKTDRASVVAVMAEQLKEMPSYRVWGNHSSDSNSDVSAAIGAAKHGVKRGRRKAAVSSTAARTIS